MGKKKQWLNEQTKRLHDFDKLIRRCKPLGFDKNNKKNMINKDNKK